MKRLITHRMKTDDPDRILETNGDPVPAHHVQLHEDIVLLLAHDRDHVLVVLYVVQPDTDRLVALALALVQDHAHAHAHDHLIIEVEDTDHRLFHAHAHAHAQALDLNLGQMAHPGGGGITLLQVLVRGQKRGRCQQRAQ